MPVTFSSYRLGPGQRASYKTVPPPWDWLLRRKNELGPRRSKSQIIFAVLVPPLYVAVQAPALIVTLHLLNTLVKSSEYFRFVESLRTCIMASQSTGNLKLYLRICTLGLRSSKSFCFECYMHEFVSYVLYLNYMSFVL